jgi:hypothetical protein
MLTPGRRGRNPSKERVGIPLRILAGLPAPRALPRESTKKTAAPIKGRRPVSAAGIGRPAAWKESYRRPVGAGPGGVAIGGDGCG